MAKMQLLFLVCAMVSVFDAHAIIFDWDIGEGISGRLNTSVVLGAAWRMEERDPDLIAKANLNPDVCANQSCQGTSQSDFTANEDRLNAPGAFSNNHDNGNLNYDQYDLTSGLIKLNQDLMLAYGDWSFFARIYGFYDEVNNDFTEFRPNLITRHTKAKSPPALLPFGPNTFGAGDVVYRKRRDKGVLEQVGADIELMDAFVNTEVTLPGERNLQLRLGRQTVNWGESTLAVINSLNQVNPPNLNNLFRVGAELSEVFMPVGLLYASVDLSENFGLETFYQYEWEGIQIPAPGSFLSFADVGTDNIVDHGHISIGSLAEVDEPGLGAPLNNPLSGLTNTSTRLERLPDRTPDDGGQYGFALRYFADWLNDGTELAFYAMNYHSRLPYLSMYSTDPSCARREGNPLGIDATDAASLLLTCPDLPVLHPNDPSAATDDAVHFDSARFVFEYPEDIRLYGMSFNTSFDDLAIQGEIAYRPDLPMQLDIEDLNYAAFGPTLTRCHDPNSGPLGSGCTGSVTSGPDTFSIGAPIGGDAPGSGRAFPSFVNAYRGIAQGETPPNSYIRGWESFAAYQFNLGGTVVGNPPLMDQLAFFFELAATWVPDMPDQCELSLEAPGTFNHASRGVDGTGSPGYGGRACDPGGANFAYVDGPDGLRFNATQQVGGFPDDFSWGYRLIFIPRWESVLPGISVQSIIMFMDDVKGTAPGPGENFVEGRQTLVANVETRYRDNWSFTLGYTLFRGPTPYVQLADRDYASVAIKYSF